MRDTVNAFVSGTSVRIDGTPGGPLSGLTFAAKDLFDVAGHPTGGGNPDWAAYNPVPTRHAWAVQTLLDAGADLIGKTITDEVSLGILGENESTARRSTAPRPTVFRAVALRLAAVAAGLCDTALGTATGGSVRVPASLRPAWHSPDARPHHPRRYAPQAPTSDTTGWFNATRRRSPVSRR